MNYRRTLLIRKGVLNIRLYEKEVKLRIMHKTFDLVWRSGCSPTGFLNCPAGLVVIIYTVYLLFNARTACGPTAVSVGPIV